MGTPSGHQEEVTAPLRAVLDTNVVLPALIFAQSRLTSLRVAWQSARFIPLVSTATTEELVRALSYPKFKLNVEQQRELLADYLPYCAPVRLPTKRPKVPACRDPRDIPFLELAHVGKAECLVSGDRDLLSLADQFTRRIVTPSEFLALLNAA